MATHSSILTWRIPWREEPGRLQPMGHKESDTTEWFHFSYMYLLPLGPLSHPPSSHASRLSQDHQAELPALYSRFQLAIYFIHGCVHKTILRKKERSMKTRIHKEVGPEWWGFDIKMRKRRGKIPKTMWANWYFHKESTHLVHYGTTVCVKKNWTVSKIKKSSWELIKMEEL